MTVAALSVAVQLRASTQALLQLTNDDPTLTSINATRLDAACADAIGDFERITGMTHDTSNYSHVATLVTGVLYYLEKYKSREGVMMTSHMKQFYGSCEGFRRLGWVSPSTSMKRFYGSCMDRTKKVWQSGGDAITPQETADFS